MTLQLENFDMESFVNVVSKAYVDEAVTRGLLLSATKDIKKVVDNFRKKPFFGIKLISDDGSKSDVDIPYFLNFVSTVDLDLISLIRGIICFDDYYTPIDFGGMDIQTSSGYHLVDREAEPMIMLYNAIVKSLSPLLPRSIVITIKAINDDLEDQAKIITNDDLDMLNQTILQVVSLFDLEPLSPSEMKLLTARLSVPVILFDRNLYESAFNGFLSNFNIDPKLLKQPLSAVESIFSGFHRYLNSNDIVASMTTMVDFREYIEQNYLKLDLPDTIKTLFSSLNILKDLKVSNRDLKTRALKYADEKFKIISEQGIVDDLNHLRDEIRRYYLLVSFVKDINWSKPVKGFRSLAETLILNGYIKLDKLETILFFTIITNPGILIDVANATVRWAVAPIELILELIFRKIKSILPF